MGNGEPLPFVSLTVALQNRLSDTADLILLNVRFYSEMMVVLFYFIFYFFHKLLLSGPSAAFLLDKEFGSEIAGKIQSSPLSDAAKQARTTLSSTGIKPKPAERVFLFPCSSVTLPITVHITSFLQ